MTGNMRERGWRPGTPPPEFCPACGVSADLHSGPNTCDSAEAKARLIEAFCGSFKRSEVLGR